MKLPQTMRLVALAFVVTGTPLLLPAQPGPADAKPVPAWAGQYDSFSRSEDVYIVSKGDKKGVVSLAGKPVTQLVYDTILPFREGMAIVGTLQRGRFKTRGKYGFINKQGRLVVPMVHAGLESYSEGGSHPSRGVVLLPLRRQRGENFVFPVRQPALPFSRRHVRI